MLEEKKKHRKKKSRKPSAMSQVHNQVNAGVMDGVVYGGGGMMEGAEPEKDEFLLAGEKGAPVGGKYYHVVPEGKKTIYITESQAKDLKLLLKAGGPDKAINESSDSVTFGGMHFTCYDSEAYPFISFIRKDGTKTKIFVGDRGSLHSTLPAALLSNHEISKEEFGSLWDIKADEKRSGRVWITESCTVISFYAYDSDPKKTYNNCLDALMAVQEKSGENFNIGGTMVDLWTYSVKYPVIMPVRWFNNGTADYFLPMTKKCIPVQSFTGEYEYELDIVKNGFQADWVKLDWKGDVVESDEHPSTIYESKTMKNNDTYRKYIKSFIDFLHEQGMKIDPLPKIKLDDSEQDCIFIKTGYYDPYEKKVVVYTNGRHPKDVLRTVAHEFVHHMQNLENPNKDWGGGGDLEQDGKLRAIEGEAFLLGNILFREWTEKMKKTKELNESINVKKALRDLKKRRDPDNIKNWGRLNESHYDEYYHFTEMDNLISLLRDGKLYFAGSDKNPRTSPYAGLENQFRGGENGYLSLTRMRNIEQGYQYGQSKNHRLIARITFDGNVLNNLRDVSIKPIDFIYNWNKTEFNTKDGNRVKYPQNYLPQDVARDKGGPVLSNYTGKELYSNGDANKEWSDHFGDSITGDRFRENVKRQFQAQAEESLVLANGKGCLDAKELNAAIKRIDILIQAVQNTPTPTPKYVIENWLLNLGEFADRIFVYPPEAREYFNLGKDNGSVNVKNYIENKEYNDYWHNYASMQGALKESRMSESPDSIDCNGFRLRYWDEDAIPFLFLRDGKEFYVGKPGETHMKLLDEVGVSQRDIMKFSSNRDDITDLKRTGRYWKNANIISFWLTPNETFICDAISRLLNKLNIPVSSLLVDMWETHRIVPFRWLNNGTYDMLKELGLKCVYPIESRTSTPNSREFMAEFKDGQTKKLNIKGDFIDEMDFSSYYPIYESVETELVEPDDVDLSSFNIKKYLNPKFWEDGHLDTRIRLKLLDIADDFFDSLGIDWVEPEDVIMTGSLANYNWNEKYSDIDLHILVDYEDVDERIDFVRDFFTLKKNEWNQKHKGLKIFGFPVEVYVQDANEPHASSGVYSIDRDEWITEPDREKIRSGKVNKKHIREMVSTYMNKIDCLVDIYRHHKDDKHEMEQVAKDAAEMMDEIKNMRKEDLAKYGREMCDGNVIFKALRRSDYIGKLIKLKNLAYDKINSL